jgi:hypothetical protein
MMLSSLFDIDYGQRKYHNKEKLVPPLTNFSLL